MLRDSLSPLLQQSMDHEVVTLEEEQTLLQSAQMGDTTAAQTLVSHNMRFILSIASQYQAPGIALSDLVQEGVLGAYEAIEKYDKNKAKGRFINFAGYWIKGYISRFAGVEHQFSAEGEEFLDENSYEKAAEAGNARAPKEADVQCEEREETALIRRAIGTLEPKHQQVLIPRLIEGKKLAQIGREHFGGISVAAVRQRLSRAMVAFQGALAEVQRPKDHSNDTGHSKAASLSSSLSDTPPSVTVEEQALVHKTPMDEATMFVLVGKVHEKLLQHRIDIGFKRFFSLMMQSGASQEEAVWEAYLGRLLILDAMLGKPWGAALLQKGKFLQAVSGGKRPRDAIQRGDELRHILEKNPSRLQRDIPVLLGQLALGDRVHECGQNVSSGLLGKIADQVLTLFHKAPISEETARAWSGVDTRTKVSFAIGDYQILFNYTAAGAVPHIFSPSLFSSSFKSLQERLRGMNSEELSAFFQESKALDPVRPLEYEVVVGGGGDSVFFCSHEEDGHLRSYH